MANPNRPGLRPVRSKYGLTSWDLSFADPCLVDDALFDTEASAIAVGTPVMYTSTENAITGELGHLRYVVPLTDEEVTPAETLAGTAVEHIAGVVVGITKKSAENTSFNNLKGQFFGDPSDLGPGGKYVTSAEVEADPDGVLIWIANADDWVYEGQVETASQEINVGLGLDITSVDDGADEIVDTTTGLSVATLTAEGTDPRFIVTHVPNYIDNDPEAADARVWVRVADVFNLDTALGLGTID